MFVPSLPVWWNQQCSGTQCIAIQCNATISYQCDVVFMLSRARAHAIHFIHNNNQCVLSRSVGKMMWKPTRSGFISNQIKSNHQLKGYRSNRLLLHYHFRPEIQLGLSFTTYWNLCISICGFFHIIWFKTEFRDAKFFLHFGEKKNKFFRWTTQVIIIIMKIKHSSCITTHKLRLFFAPGPVDQLKWNIQFHRVRNKKIYVSFYDENSWKSFKKNQIQMCHWYRLLIEKKSFFVSLPNLKPANRFSDDEMSGCLLKFTELTSWRFRMRLKHNLLNFFLASGHRKLSLNQQFISSLTMNDCLPNSTLALLALIMIESVFNKMQTVKDSDEMNKKTTLKCKFAPAKPAIIWLIVHMSSIYVYIYICRNDTCECSRQTSNTGGEKH